MFSYIYIFISGDIVHYHFFCWEYKLDSTFPFCHNCREAFLAVTGKREGGKYRKPFREFVFIVVALLFPFRQSVVCWRDLFLLFCGKRDRKKLYFRKNRKKSCCRPWPWNFCQIFYHWTKMIFPNKNPFEKKCHKSIFPYKKAVTLGIVLLPMGLLHSTTWAPHFSRTIQGGGRREMVQSIYLTALAVTNWRRRRRRQKPTILREEEGRGGPFSLLFLFSRGTNPGPCSGKKCQKSFKGGNCACGTMLDAVIYTERVAYNSDNSVIRVKIIIQKMDIPYKILVAARADLCFINSIVWQNLQLSFSRVLKQEQIKEIAQLQCVIIVFQKIIQLFFRRLPCWFDLHHVNSV